MRAISCFFLTLALWAQTSALEEYRLGHLAAAAKLAKQAVETNPSNAEAKLLLSLVHAAQGLCETEQPVLANAFHDKGALELRRLAGLAALQCAVAQEKPETGLPLFEEMKRLFPQDADLLYLGAKLYLKGWNRQVADMFQSAPDSYRVNQLSGEIFETQGNFVEAAAEYQKAIAKNPQAVNLHFRRGRVLLLASHEPATLEEARREFEAELALNAEDAAAVYQIGQIRQAQGDPTSAMTHFEQAAALQPKFTEALLALAKGRMRERRAAQAIELFRRVIALQPENETAHYQLMLAYRSTGNSTEADKEKATLDRLQKPPGGEFSDFLKKLGEKPAQ